MKHNHPKSTVSHSQDNEFCQEPATDAGSLNAKVGSERNREERSHLHKIPGEGGGPVPDAESLNTKVGSERNREVHEIPGEGEGPEP